MKNYLPAIFILLLFAASAGGQNRFIRDQSIPVVSNSVTLNNPWAGGINFPITWEFDLNHDGRKDMFMYDRFSNRVLPFLNMGDTLLTTWKYAPQYIDSFPQINQWAVLHDYNCDNQEDLFMLSTTHQSGIDVYRNDYLVGNHYQWTLVKVFLSEDNGGLIPQPGIYANQATLPAFEDIDGDGDMDILGFNPVPDGHVIYHINLSVDSGYGCDSLVFRHESDCFGDFSLVMGGGNSVSCFHCPCASPPPPNPHLVSDLVSYDQSEAARRDDTTQSILAFDEDGDGVKDLLIGDIASQNSLMIHNGGSAAVAEMDTKDDNFPSYDVSALYQGFHYHSYMDLNNDGKKDLLVEAGQRENSDGLWYYRNINTTASPTFEYVTSSFLQDQMIEVGENATPVFFDYDGDGLLDLVIGGNVFQSATGSLRGSLFLYKNTGTSTHPQFQFITNDFGGIAGQYTAPLYPAFGDLDGDGDKDMILGTDDGKLQYFQNTAGPGNPAQFVLQIPNLDTIDVGFSSAPQLIDLDRNGTLDLVVGEKDGFLNFFKNGGTTTSFTFSRFPNSDTLGGIVLQFPGYFDGFTVPYFYDSAGSYRLMVADMMGNVYMYDQIDGNVFGNYRMIDSLYPRPESFRLYPNLSVSGGDINGDGLTDLVIGQASGGVEMWMQKNPTSGITEVDHIKPTFEVFPNPAHDELTIEAFNTGEINQTRVRIIDATGRIVLERPMELSVEKLDVHQYASGLYLIQLTGERGSVSRKVLIR